MCVPARVRVVGLTRVRSATMRWASRARCTAASSPRSARGTPSWKVRARARGLCVCVLTPPAVPNPLGVVAVLSAFNFPVAVYGW